MNVKGKQVLVIGLGESGLAMVRWLLREGAAVRVVDSRQSPPNVVALTQLASPVELVCGGFPDAAFAGIDLMAISPGVPVETPAVQAALASGVPLISEIELFAWGVRREASSSRILAITGSNGKTTTTALTAHLLNKAGISAVACGNISPSALDALMAAQDANVMPSVWVLELSSFQLETTHSLNADAATILNVSEDHLDRHTGMAGYAAAKARVFEGCGVRVINRDDEIVSVWQQAGDRCVSFGLKLPAQAHDYGISAGWIVRGLARVVELQSLPISGLHNAANVMAALALCEAIGAAPVLVAPGLASFSGLAHRVEKVAEIAGVTYFDDSKGTNVGATLAALQGLGRKVAIILGGEGKDQDFTPLRGALAEHGRVVALIGRDAPLIARAIEGCGVMTRYCADLDEAVRWCAEQTQSGDAVLLSPACASFDMFRNYGHRAAVFIEAVRRLESETA